MEHTLDAARLRELARRSGLCVSVYVPTEPAGRGRLEGAIRLKNSIDLAHRMLVEAGMRPTIARGLLSEVDAIPQAEDIWMAGSRGLALFFSDQGFQWYLTPFGVPDLTVVGPRFHVRPLIPALAHETCCVLAMHEKEAKLLEVTEAGHRDVSPPDMPRSLDEALGPEFSEKQRQMHAVGPQGRLGSVSHGAGDRAADQKDKDLRYCQAVDRAVVAFLNRSEVPLVLACTEPILSIYRHACRYPNVSTEAIEGWPGRTTDAELAREARAIMGRLRDARVNRALQIHAELESEGRTLKGVEAIVPAAASGKVDTLFSDRDTVVWGQVDDQHQATAIEGQEPWAEDLINRAAIETLAHGGSVIELERGRLPVGVSAMCTLRY